ncbi:MAG: hypothetical protein P8Y68_12890, partial [Anaerolineales bacterium]
MSKDLLNWSPSFEGIKSNPIRISNDDFLDDLILVVLFAGDSVAPCTPRRDIDVPDPAKMLIG